MHRYKIDFASHWPQMYDKQSRKRKALRILKALSFYVGTSKIKNLTALDIGCSTGLIDLTLSKKLHQVIGIDTDNNAIKFAKKQTKRSNLIFQTGNALKLDFPLKTFDIVICTHVYEHTENQSQLFSEIYRVLKPGGICYLAAQNKLQIIEAHHRLPFLSWLPKPIANLYLRTFGKYNQYYENPKSYWGLLALTKKFKRAELTQKILRHPQKFGYEDIIKPNSPVSIAAYILSPLAKYFSPTFFWILEK